MKGDFKMEKIIEKLINKQEITDEDLAEELYDICDREHAFCNSNCPIYALKDRIPWNKDKTNCLFFRSGRKMLERLRKE